MMNESLYTHPESLWLVLGVPLWITIAGLLALTLALRGRMLAALADLLQQHARRGDRRLPDAPHLHWTPTIATPGQLLAVLLLAALVLIATLSRIAPMFTALLLAGPALTLIVWGLLLALEARYRSNLERALPAAVGRLAGLLRGGSSFTAALNRVIDDLPAGPLRAEWEFIAAALATPVGAAGIATSAQAVAALAEQTPSPRHGALLGHLEVALDQPHDVLTRRVQAAASALYAAEQRRSAAATELAQMRYSGIAIGLAGAGMSAFLWLTQPDRFAQAYGGPFGAVAAALLITALLAPIAGGMLLAQIDDIEY